MRAWFVVAVAACGPSSSEIKTAQTAKYNATPAQVLELAEQVTQETYQIGDVTTDGFVTHEKFYSPEGDLESPGAGDFVHLRGGSVMVKFHVKVIPTADHEVMVTVTPETYQIIAWSPKPRSLQPDDPALPPFIKGRAEALSLAIYEHAKPYVAAPPGVK